MTNMATTEAVDQLSGLAARPILGIHWQVAALKDCPSESLRNPGNARKNNLLLSFVAVTDLYWEAHHR